MTAEQATPECLVRLMPGLSALVLFVVTLVGLALATYERLAPESSPIARGAAYAATHRCLDNSCTQELAAGLQVCTDLSGEVSCADVIAYWTAKRLKQTLGERIASAPENLLLKGEALARKRHCFRCHGELGQGGVANTGALKGYIPGYFGEDFRSLTDGGDRETIKEWIKTGSSRSITKHPLTGFMASYFIKRQTVSMPLFASLPEHEIELLASYLMLLNRLGPLNTEGLKCYTILTISRTYPLTDCRLVAAKPQTL